MKKAQDSIVCLEPITKEHISKTFAWVSNTHLRTTFLLRGEITWAGHVNYFNNVLADPTQLLYAILYESEHVGNCGFKHLDVVDASAELWIYLGSPEMRGKGIGGEAARLLLKKGVDWFGLKRIQVHVAESNKQALQLYLSLGFVGAGECDPEWTGHGSRILKMFWESKVV